MDLCCLWFCLDDFSLRFLLLGCVFDRFVGLIQWLFNWFVVLSFACGFPFTLLMIWICSCGECVWFVWARTSLVWLHL